MIISLTSSRRRPCLLLILLAATAGCGSAEQNRTDAQAEAPATTPASADAPLPVTDLAVPTDSGPLSADGPLTTDTAELEDPRALQQQAAEALETGDSDRAWQLVRMAKRQLPEDPEVTFLMARVLAQRHRFHEAVKILDDLAKAVPETRLPALGQTAEWLVEQGEWAEAERRYRQLLELVGDTSLVDSQLASLLLRQGRRIEAADPLRRLCRQGQVSEANLRALLTLAKPFPGDATEDAFEPIGKLGQARVELGKNNLAEALNELEPTADLTAAEWSLRGRILALQQDWESLAQWADGDLPESADQHADFWFAKAVAAAGQGQHRQAIKSFCQTVLRDPTDAAAYRAMSRSLAQLEMDSESQRAEQRAAQIERTQQIGAAMAASDERDLGELSTLADTLIDLGRPLEALAWRAVLVYYESQSGQLDQQQEANAMTEINRERLAILSDENAFASEQEIFCGVEPGSL